MSLTDVVSHLDLSVYPELALVLFLAVFVAVTWRAIRTPGGVARRHASLALDDAEELASTPSEEARLG